MRTFRSDNNAALTPEAMNAIICANAPGDHQIGYGDDAHTQRAVGVFKELFGKDIAVFFVATGSAANTLALAALTQPWEQVLCHSHSHINCDESTTPERFTHCRITPIHPAGGRPEWNKITVEDFKASATYSRGDVHQPQPGVFSISNSTEFGLVYSPAEVKALCAAAHAGGYRVHMDGARFANAVAANNCDPCELTNSAGIDALSFGGTKNGLAFGEAVVFFPQGDGGAFERAVSAFPFHRKGTGHLLSKHRFVSTPFAATIADGSWLRHAKRANTMAKELSEGLSKLGLPPRFPTQANAVFVELPPQVDAALQSKGHGYYPFGNPAWNLTRLMCSFDTSPVDVAGFLADVQAAMHTK